MSFEHAQEMHSKYNALGFKDICVPTSLDASLHHTDVPEDFYPESHDMLHTVQHIEDPEVRGDITVDFTRRLVTGTFGADTPVMLGIDTSLVYELKSGKGNPFLVPTTNEIEAEYESVLEGHVDLQDYIGEAKTNSDAEKIALIHKSDRVRHFFVLSRLRLDHGYTLNLEVCGNDLGNHQIGLRQEDEDEFYLVDTWATDDNNLLRKIGPLTLREVCGIRNEQWSRRPADWPEVNKRDLRPLKVIENGVPTMFTHIFPSESNNVPANS